MGLLSSLRDVAPGELVREVSGNTSPLPRSAAQRLLTVGACLALTGLRFAQHLARLRGGQGVVEFAWFLGCRL